MISKEANDLVEITGKTLEEITLLLRKNVRRALKERFQRNREKVIAQQIVLGTAREALSNISNLLLNSKGNTSASADYEYQDQMDPNTDLLGGMGSVFENGTGGGKRVIRGTNSLA
ncbi:MAG: hypothetical protein KAS32_11235 [Candidatus Peribacteraceae bacterium]|nr:hypothetical protein [Candidatus Peribacteraceae bacterium]